MALVATATGSRERVAPARAIGWCRRVRAAPALGVMLAALGVAPAACAQDAARFPKPDRPVAAIISAEYSTEETRDAKGEATRVLDHLGVRPGMRVADIGAGLGYYVARLARRLGPGATIYAQDVSAETLGRLQARVARERLQGVRLVHGDPNDPKLPPAQIDLALLSHVYHEIDNPYEFFYRLHPALAAGARVAVVDNDKPTGDHGTPPALLRCELAAVGYREVDRVSLAPADGYLAVFVPPDRLPPVDAIRPCRQ
jgi:SAM-dependent methyltransferase